MKKSRIDNIVDKEFVSNIKNEINSDATEQKAYAMSVALGASGSRANPPDSPYYRQWLAQRMESNKFLRHVESAPEYNTPTRNLGGDIYDADNELVKSELDLANMEVIDYDKDVEDVFKLIPQKTPTEAVKHFDSAPDELFMDTIILENLVRSLPETTSNEEIKTEATKLIMEHHEDESYVINIDFNTIIDNTKLMISMNKTPDIKKININ